jgi:hypothetical protein
MQKKKKRRLKNLRINAVSLVDRGANQKDFLLLKRHSKGEKLMTKELAIKLVKSGNLEDSEINSVLEQVPEADHEEVKKASSVNPSKEIEVGEMVDQIVEKVGAKLSKDNAKKLSDISAQLSKAVETLKGMMGKVEKNEENEDPEVSDEEVEKALSNLQEEFTEA